MAHWLALLSHHKKVPSLTPGKDRPFCVEFACSLCQCWAYAAYSDFLPQPKDMQVRHAKLYLEDSKFVLLYMLHIDYFKIYPSFVCAVLSLKKLY